MALPIGKWGRILDGIYTNWFIMIDYDSEDTGGYYIYYAKDKDDSTSEGYDHWYENYEQVEKDFSRWKLNVDWE